MTLDHPDEHGCRVVCQVDSITQRLGEPCLFLQHTARGPSHIIRHP
ncbi:hypothetical protein CGRA01v4_06383 [Colletotrichum graminicola]|nr:hypothetical protein CGRA01v4_06383 [Colletotrichum graminicola]